MTKIPVKNPSVRATAPILPIHFRIKLERKEEVLRGGWARNMRREMVGGTKMERTMARERKRRHTLGCGIVHPALASC